MAEIHIDFKVFFFADHSTPVGYLIHDRRAQACWYFVTCAHKNLALVEGGAVYEGELDTPNLLGNLVRSIATIYGIKDPSEMLKFMPMCKKEAERCHYEWNPLVENPDPKNVSRGATTPTIQ